MYLQQSYSVLGMVALAQDMKPTYRIFVHPTARKWQGLHFVQFPGVQSVQGSESSYYKLTRISYDTQPVQGNQQNNKSVSSLFFDAHRTNDFLLWKEALVGMQSKCKGSPAWRHFSSGFWSLSHSKLMWEGLSFFRYNFPRLFWFSNYHIQRFIQLSNGHLWKL